MDKAKEWQMELLMEKLRSKAGQFKSFVESAKALRMSLLVCIISYTVLCTNGTMSYACMQAKIHVK